MKTSPVTRTRRNARILTLIVGIAIAVSSLYGLIGSIATMTTHQVVVGGVSCELITDEPVGQGPYTLAQLPGASCTVGSTGAKFRNDDRGPVDFGQMIGECTVPERATTWRSAGPVVGGMQYWAGWECTAPVSGGMRAARAALIYLLPSAILAIGLYLFGTLLKPLGDSGSTPFTRSGVRTLRHVSRLGALYAGVAVASHLFAWPGRETGLVFSGTFAAGIITALAFSVLATVWEHGTTLEQEVGETV